MERKLKWKCNVCNEPVKVGQRTKHLREKHPELKDAKSVEYFVLNIVPKKAKKEKQPKPKALSARNKKIRKLVNQGMDVANLAVELDLKEITVEKEIRYMTKHKLLETPKRKGLLKVRHPKPSKATKVEKSLKREEKAEVMQKTNGKLIVKGNGKLLVIPIVPKGLTETQFKRLLKSTNMTPKEFYDLPTDMKEKIVKAEKELIEVA